MIGEIWRVLSGLVNGIVGALPLWSIKFLVIGIFLGLAGWSATLSEDYVFQGAPDHSRWRDLRIWAAIVIGLVILPYLFF